jgi:hypothetical protein
MTQKPAPKILLPARSLALVEGKHPAPVFTFAVAAANFGYLIVFTYAHSPFWKGPGWLLFLLFPVVGVGFSVLFDWLIKRQQLHLALRTAWGDLEDLVYEHLNTTICWFRQSDKEDDIAPGWKDLKEFSTEYWKDTVEALDLLPVTIRHRMRKDLGKLPVDAVLWSYLKDIDPAAYDPYLSEKIYLDPIAIGLHSRFSKALRPDLTHTIVAVAVGIR